MVPNQVTHLFRRLLRSPMFTFMTLLTLAVGIGANTAIFSVVNGVLLKPLPYPNAERLAGIWLTAPGIGIKELNMSPSTYFTFRETSRTLEEVGIYNGGSESVTGLGEPEQVVSLNITDGILPILGIQPARGRAFGPADMQPKAPDVVVLSYGYWQRKLGGSLNAVGQKLTLSGRPYEVIGVMPEGFTFANREAQMFLPLRFDRNEVHLGNFSYSGIARMKPGVTIEQVNADIARMLPIYLRTWKSPGGISVKAFEEIKMAPNSHLYKQDVIGDVGKMLWVLMATVGIVLFIACANVANLLLVRADGRQQELAVRAALGASWRRIAGELMLESVTLGIIGGVLGVGVAYGAIRLLVYLAPTSLPRLHEITLDPIVLVFAFAISVLAGVLFGLIPVLKYARPSIGLALRSGGRTSSDGRERHMTRSALVVVQVALALVLLVGSGLMIRTMLALQNVNPGFTHPERLLTLRLSIPEAQVKEPERVARMHNDIIDRIAAIGGVQSVSVTNSVTMDGSNNNDPIYIEERTYSDTQVPPIRRFKHIGPGYIKAMGNRLVAGRDFTWTEIYGVHNVVMISENLAREFWKNPADAVGKRIRESTKGPWREVIGVVGDERDDGVDKKATTIVYWPFMTKGVWGDNVNIRRSLSYVIRSDRASSQDFIKQVQQAVWSVNSNLPLARVRTVQEIYDRSLARSSFTLVMLSIASGMALLLGIVGIYGVISYSISQRTREIGIRIALGAPSANVRGLFVRHGLILAGIGVVCGLAASIPLARLLTTLLFEVSPLDPITYVGVAVVLVLAALLATYIPAHRATRIEPVEALRAE